MSVAEHADRSPYRGYRFPPEITAHAVWLYFHFHLSFHDVQDLLAERGIVASHETIRQWCTKSGATAASTTSASRRQVASGRSCVEDPWQTSLAVASNGSSQPSTRNVVWSRSAQSPTTSATYRQFRTQAHTAGKSRLAGARQLDNAIASGVISSGWRRGSRRRRSRSWRVKRQANGF